MFADGVCTAYLFVWHLLKKEHFQLTPNGFLHCYKNRTHHILYDIMNTETDVYLCRFCLPSLLSLFINPHDIQTKLYENLRIHLIRLKMLLSFFFKELKQAILVRIHY